MKNSGCVIGLMSGSSLDGLDVAAAEISVGGSGKELAGWQLLDFETLPFPESLRNRLRDLPKASGLELARAHAEMGRWMGEQVRDFIQRRKLQPELIASHGHTVFHDPAGGMSCQIGEGAAIAALTRLPVVCDFRTLDIALGGQGAPLAPLADQWLFPGHGFYLNLGGIANISYPSKAGMKAYDIGPANQVLNALAGEKGLAYDEDGRLARRGSCRPELLEEVSSLAFFAALPPKSLDNNWIREVVFPIYRRKDLSPEDRLNTACIQLARETGRCIRGHLDDLAPEAGRSLLVTGGGAHNRFLIEQISRFLPEEIRLELPPPEIIDAKEALLIALMGVFRMRESINCYQSVTGSSRDSVGGCIYWGKEG